MMCLSLVGRRFCEASLNRSITFVCIAVFALPQTNMRCNHVCECTPAFIPTARTFAASRAELGTYSVRLSEAGPYVSREHCVSMAIEIYGSYNARRVRTSVVQATDRGFLQKLGKTHTLVL